MCQVSAAARPGQILAVVGPSGAGKSTFLDAIGGRIHPASLQGTILVNGAPMQTGFRRISAYVMQDDALFAQLTVRETLLYSARLRLPGSMSLAEKAARVEDILTQLGLARCADTLVGNESRRGVSGGERRRTSIGIELIHDPAVLILDEPTSGLDSTSSLSVLEVLHDLATEGGRTVILTIHQPSFRMLELLDSLLLLAKGRVVYEGSVEGLYAYFHHLGADVPEHVNVLEYALDVVEENQDVTGWLSAAHRGQKASARPQAGGLGIGGQGIHASSLGLLLQERPAYATGLLEEFRILCSRSARIQLRNWQQLASRFAVMVVMGLTVGTLFFDCKLSPEGVVQRDAVLAFVVALLIYNSMDGLPVFIQERQVFLRETSRGAYRPASFALAGALVGLPALVLLALVLSSCAYWLAGLARTAPAYFLFVLACFLTLAMAQAFVAMWAAAARSYYVANGIVAAFASYFFLFSGFFIDRKSIPGWWIWLHYFNLFKYPLEVLTWNEYHSLRNTCFDGGSAPAGAPCASTGHSILAQKEQGKVKPALNLAIMLLFTVAFRFFFFLALKVRSQSTRK